MKNIFSLKTLALVACLGFLFVGCDDFDDLNVDPNSPTDVPPSNLLTQAEFNLYSTLHGRVLNAEWGLLMVQQWAQNEYGEESRYLVDANTFDATWTTIYAGVINELTVAKAKIQEDPNLAADRRANQIGVIDILLSDAYHTLTDFWGAIPYSQAISADFPNPCYDTQQDVYIGILNSLDAALQGFSESTGSFAGGDLIYNGDISKWKQFGASLMLRIAMRASDADQSLAMTYVQKAIGYGVLPSASDEAVFWFDENPDLANPLYIDNTLNGRDDFAVSEVLVNTLRSMEDPRIDMFSNLTPAGTIVGMPYGLSDADAFALKSTTSRPSSTVRSATAPHIIFSFSEVAFLMAEAIERGFTSGDAEEWYNQGVQASLDYWGVGEAGAAYLAANPYNAADWKNSIGMQKWISFYMSGVQGWAEWRRLDVPSLDVPAAASNPSIPVRMPYPISEDTRNGTCLSQVTSDINDLDAKMWWDVN